MSGRSPSSAPLETNSTVFLRMPASSAARASSLMSSTFDPNETTLQAFAGLPVTLILCRDFRLFHLGTISSPSTLAKLLAYVESSRKFGLTWWYSLETRRYGRCLVEGPFPNFVELYPLLPSSQGLSVYQPTTPPLYSVNMTLDMSPSSTSRKPKEKLNIQKFVALIGKCSSPKPLPMSEILNPDFLTQPRRSASTSKPPPSK